MEQRVLVRVRHRPRPGRPTRGAPATPQVLARHRRLRPLDRVGCGTPRQFVPRLLAGRRPRLVQGDLDAPHSFTYVDDVVTTLVALATEERAWGRAWHVSTAPAVTVREVARRTAAVAGVPGREVQVLPRAAVRLGGVAVPFLRELPEVRYQFAQPFVLDSTAARRAFGLSPTPLDEGLAATVAWWREQAKAAA